MRVGSLFSGIGGFDLGFKRAGMECAWQVEIDAKCRALLADKFTNVAIHEDVNHVGRSNLAPVDLICGGFPCQDLSVAGRRAGLAGERSGLWFQFQRVLEEMRPRWCVIENVPGLLSSAKGRDFAVIVQALVELGYCVSWRVLDAQYAGLAQRRKRVFIVGSLGDGRSAEVLFEPESVRWHPAPSRTARERVAPSLESRSRSGGVSTDFALNGGVVAHNGCDNLIPQVAGTLTNRDSKGADSSPKEGHLIPVPATGFHLTQDPIAETELTPAMGSKTYTLGAHGAFGVRRLTPRECERLQGFPDDWTAAFADTVRYRMLGNAVAVPVAEWIARRIVACDAAS
jgi:DNA (cytosine-5)-methyltransferase 1